MTRLFLILLAAAGAALLIILLKFGTIDPCGIVRAEVRQAGERAGGFGGVVASALPDVVIDGIIATQYGPLSPSRCIALAFAGAPAQAPVPPQAPPPAPLDYRQGGSSVVHQGESGVPSGGSDTDTPPPNSAAALKRAGDEVTAAVTECSYKRLSGELKKHVDAANCANARIIDAFQTAGYRYMDLIYLLTAKMLELSEKRDDKQLTQAQAQLEFAQFMVRFADEERQRDREQR